MSSLDELEQQALQAVATAGNSAALDDVRVCYLGKKGLLTQQLKQLGALPADEGRPRDRQSIASSNRFSKPSRRVVKPCIQPR